MPRKPNYGFERRKREKARALKKAIRLQAKHEKSDRHNQEIRNHGSETDGRVSPTAGLPK